MRAHTCARWRRETKTEPLNPCKFTPLLAHIFSAQDPGKSISAALRRTEIKEAECRSSKELCTARMRRMALCLSLPSCGCNSPSGFSISLAQLTKSRVACCKTSRSPHRSSAFSMRATMPGAHLCTRRAKSRSAHGVRGRPLGCSSGMCILCTWVAAHSTGGNCGSGKKGWYRSWKRLAFAFRAPQRNLASNTNVCHLRSEIAWRTGSGTMIVGTSCVSPITACQGKIGPASPGAGMCCKWSADTSTSDALKKSQCLWDRGTGSSSSRSRFARKT